MRTCDKCGVMLPDHSVFCTNCGATLAPPAQEPMPQIQPISEPVPQNPMQQQPVPVYQASQPAPTYQPQSMAASKAKLGLTLGIINQIIPNIPLLLLLIALPAMNDALVGIAALLFIIVPIVGIVLSSIGIASFKHAAKSEYQGKAAAGLVLNILTLIGSIVWLILVIYVLFLAGSFATDFASMLESYGYGGYGSYGYDSYF